MTSPFTLGSQQIAWLPVFEFARAEAALFSIDLMGDRLPVAGTPDWCRLPDGPRKTAAVLLLGAQHALALDMRQEDRAEASKAIATSADWPAVAREVRQLAAFREANPWAVRKAAR